MIRRSLPAIALSLVALAGVGASRPLAAQDTAGTARAAAPRVPASASHRAAAAELLEVSEAQRHIRDGISMAFDAQVRANPLLGPFRDVMQRYADKYLDWTSLQPELVTIYTDAFSEKELRDIVAFYRTPTGRKVVELLPEVMSRAAQVAQQRVGAHLDELQAMIQERAIELQKTPAPKEPAPVTPRP